MGKPAFLYIDYASTATVTATDTLSGKDVDDVLNATEDENWMPADQTGTKTLTIDLGSAIELDHTGLLGVDMDGVSLTIQTDDNSGFTTPTTRFTGTISSSLNSAVIVHTGSSTERYIRYQFSGMSTTFAIAHVCPDKLVEQPYFIEDWGSGDYNPTFSSLVSTSGLYAGNTQQKTMRDITLNFEEVTASEYTTLQTWITARVESAGAFFLIPDVATKTDNYFVWLNDNQGVKAPLSNTSGLREVGSISGQTRLR